MAMTAKPPMFEFDMDVEAQAHHDIQIDDVDAILEVLMAAKQMDKKTVEAKNPSASAYSTEASTEYNSEEAKKDDPLAAQDGSMPRQVSGKSNNSAGYSSEASKNSKQRRLSKLLDALEDKVEKRQIELVEQGSPRLNHLAHELAWVIFTIFAIAAAGLWGLWTFYDRNPAFVATFMVTSIAAAAYLAKATGMGDAHISGKSIPLLRYIDWIVTTPLMLYELCHIGHANTGVTIMVVGCDVLMLAFGIVGASIDHAKHFRLKYVWFFTACIFYAIMLATLHQDVANGSALKLDAHVQELFTQLEVLTISVWSFYPVVALLGRAHAKVIQKGTEDMSFMVLDCVSKIGMEGLIVVHALLHLH